MVSLSRFEKLKAKPEQSVPCMVWLLAPAGGAGVVPCCGIRLKKSLSKPDTVQKALPGLVRDKNVGLLIARFLF